MRKVLGSGDLDFRFYQARQGAEDWRLAAENLMLAIRNDGSGSCWIG
jgi:nitroreductase